MESSSSTTTTTHYDNVEQHHDDHEHKNYDDERERDSSATSLQMHLAVAKHHATVSALQHSLQVSRDELSDYRRKHAESKKAARTKVEEVSRTYQSKLHASESELQSLRERMQAVERARTSSGKELEENLTQTISLYSVIQQLQSSLDVQREKCDTADSQHALTSSKLISADKELIRLRIVLEKSHDSNERHITAMKGQLSIKSDENIALNAQYATLNDEYKSHRVSLESKVQQLERDRSLLEGVNHELRNTVEKNHNLERENESMRLEILEKHHLQGQYDTSLSQIATMSATLLRVEEERRSWTGERRDLDHALGTAQQALKQTTIERDALQIEFASTQRLANDNATEHQRRLAANHEEAMVREQALNKTIVHKDETIDVHSANIKSLDSDLAAARLEQQRLSEAIVALESSAHAAALIAEQNHIESIALQLHIDADTSTIASLNSQLSTTSAALAHESALTTRTRASRVLIVDKLDQNYSSSYSAQIFQQWIHSHRLQSAQRALAQSGERIAGILHDRDVSERMAEIVINERKSLEVRIGEDKIAHEDNMLLERSSAASKLELSLSHAKLESDSNQARAIERARGKWEEDVINLNHAERVEKHERDARINRERESMRDQIKKEMEEAGEQERAGRVPTVQSLVTIAVENALRRNAPSPSRLSSLSSIPPTIPSSVGFSDRTMATSDRTMPSSTVSSSHHRRRSSSPSSSREVARNALPYVERRASLSPRRVAENAADAAVREAYAGRSRSQDRGSHDRDEHDNRHRHYHHHDRNDVGHHRHHHHHHSRDGSVDHNHHNRHSRHHSRSSSLQLQPHSRQASLSPRPSSPPPPPMPQTHNVVNLSSVDHSNDAAPSTNDFIHQHHQRQRSLSQKQLHSDRSTQSTSSRIASRSRSPTAASASTYSSSRRLSYRAPSARSTIVFDPPPAMTTDYVPSSTSVSRRALRESLTHVPPYVIPSLPLQSILNHQRTASISASASSATTPTMRKKVPIPKDTPYHRLSINVDSDPSSLANSPIVVLPMSQRSSLVAGLTSFLNSSNVPSPRAGVQRSIITDSTNGETRMYDSRGIGGKGAKRR